VEEVSRRRGFAMGCAVAIFLLSGLAEVYLRWFPPRDLYSHLGEQSPLTGPYCADDDFSVAYRSWDEFCRENAERLKEHLPFDSDRDVRPQWAFFGNSFVQAPGMLADYVRINVTDRHVFNLGRNEHLYLRLAQIKLLLANGMKPERIFIALMPVDVIGLGGQPLATNHVTARGAITFEPVGQIQPLAWLTRYSRVALTASVRTGLRRGNPRFDQNTLYDRVDEPLLGDLRHLFGNVARVTREHNIPVTVLLIPAYHQIRKGANLTFQDILGTMLREQGYDVFDPRNVFLHHPDLDGLFVPDKHFSPRGNEILLTEMVKHVRQRPSHLDAIAGAP
jgi:hypothetical protein